MDVVGSLTDNAWRGTERTEEDFLFFRILQPLEQAGLIGTVAHSSRGAKGEPDFHVLEAGTTESKIIGETKTTHNLLLPMKALDVATQYNDARAAVDEMQEIGRAHV